MFDLKKNNLMQNDNRTNENKNEFIEKHEEDERQKNTKFDRNKKNGHKKSLVEMLKIMYLLIKFKIQLS